MYDFPMAAMRPRPLTPARLEQVRYLVQRRFPGPRPADPAAQKEIAAYQQELFALSPDVVWQMHRSEKVKEGIEDLQRRNSKLAKDFFDQPQILADFKHWSRAAYWSLEEALALSFGWNPALVNWLSVGAHVPHSELAAEYARLRDLAHRAKVMGQLHDIMLPGFFIAWARRNQQAFPEALEALVVASGHQVADWKTAYDSLKERTEELESERQEELARLNTARHSMGIELQSTLAQNEALLRENADLKAKVESPMRKGDTLSRRERESLMKLVIGMAIAGYKYRPGANRNAATAEIAGDLATSGIPLDEDTVRKWLQEAAELLPSKPNEDA